MIRKTLSTRSARTLRLFLLTAVLAAPGCSLFYAERVAVQPSENAAEPFSFATYTKVLARVDTAGRVNYKTLKTHPQDLESFYAALASVRPEELNGWSKNEQVAFWINAYNALTLKVIVDNYPLDSIKDITPPFGPWASFKYFVAGQEVTLDGIEHDILRGEELGFNEPRIHVALVCAAMGCPPLRNEPYTAERLDEQLDDQTRRMLTHPKKFKIDREKKTVGLSSIFKWYGGDFVKTYGTDEKFADHNEVQRAVLNYIHPFLSDADQTFLGEEAYGIEYLEYDWSLNEQ